MIKTNAFYEDLINSDLLVVNMGWRFFTIKFEEDVHLPETGEKAYGITDLDEGTITLESKVDDCETARETVYHELLHAVCDLVGLHPVSKEEEFVVTNEEIVTRLSKGLLLLSNLNPELMKRILYDNASCW